MGTLWRATTRGEVLGCVRVARVGGSGADDVNVICKGLLSSAGVAHCVVTSDATRPVSRWTNL